MSDVPSSAECALHPMAVATHVCGRCGVFLCTACQHLRPEGTFCPTCAARAKRAATSRAVNALVLSYCGLQFCFPILGIVGLSMAYDEQRQIAAGTSSEESRGYARWAIILGWVNVVFLGLTVVGLMALGAGFWLARQSGE